MVLGRDLFENENVKQHVRCADLEIDNMGSCYINNVSVTSKKKLSSHVRRRHVVPHYEARPNRSSLSTL